MSNVIVGLNEIRDAVFSMPESDGFTIGDIIDKIKLNNPNKEEVDARVIDAYLDQISRAGIVEKHQRKWYINKPDFGICPRCGK
jgi:hypothetical protein